MLFVDDRNFAELKTLPLQSHDKKSKVNLGTSDSSSSSDNRDNNEPQEAEGKSSEAQTISIGPDAFKRVYEFNDEQCTLRNMADDDGPFVRGSEVFDALRVRPTWICQLNQDVNLRTLLDLPRGYYTINWIFAYRIPPEFRSKGHGVQVYNCSFGKPLDAAMFRARIHDPSQPFISSNLNAIIHPRVTIPLTVPEYETMRLSEPSDDLVVRRKNEGHIICASQHVLQVEWDGPTAFLIRLVSQRVLEGRLWFMGTLLKKHDVEDHGNYQGEKYWIQREVLGAQDRGATQDSANLP